MSVKTQFKKKLSNEFMREIARKGGLSKAKRMKEAGIAFPFEDTAKASAAGKIGKRKKKVKESND